METKHKTLRNTLMVSLLLMTGSITSCTNDEQIYEEYSAMKTKTTLRDTSDKECLGWILTENGWEYVDTMDSGED